MHALLLATGERPGLQALTSQLPTPLLPIAGQPVMALVVEQLVRAGITDHLICLHDRSGAIEAFFGDGLRWGAKPTYLPQIEPLGSAGSLRWAASQIRETCVVLPADVLVDIDLQSALAFHQAQQSELTIVVAHQYLDNPASRVRIDPSGRVLALSEFASLGIVGIFLIEPSLIADLPHGRAADLVGDMLPKWLQAGRRVYSFILEGSWNPLASPADYLAAQRQALDTASADEIARGRIAGRQIGEGVWVGRNHAIHPSAKIIPPVVIGNNCQIGRDVELGPYAVIGDGCILRNGCTVANSSILPHTYVGQLVSIEGRVVDAATIVDAASGERVEISDAFLLGPASPDSFASVTQRMFDALIAALLLIVLAPLMLVVGLFALLSTGQLLQPERRLIGMRGQAGSASATPIFLMMQRFATRRNGQAHGLGRLIEQFELDHLPALWHVLVGELALIGIKPLNEAEAAEVREPWQQRRFDRQAGLTGLWYVQPERHSPLNDLLIADAYYVSTRSAGGDLRLLAQTPAAWMRRIRQPSAGLAEGVPSPVSS
jgi:NDP-sugar pyrophosphorylase family protein